MRLSLTGRDVFPIRNCGGARGGFRDRVSGAVGEVRGGDVASGDARAGALGRC